MSEDISPQFDIPAFVNSFTDDNSSVMLSNLLSSPSGKDESNIMGHLNTIEPIIDHDLFSVAAYGLEHIAYKYTNGIKTEALSTFLSVFCIKVKKESELVIESTSDDIKQHKLYALSKSCCNMQPSFMTMAPCLDQSVILFSAIKMLDKGFTIPTYFTVIAFYNKQSIH